MMITMIRQLKRVVGLLEGERIYYGGVFNEKERYISPTIVVDSKPESKILTEEIFGPILPVLPYDNIEQVLHFINQRPKPLALYIFSTNRRFRVNIIVTIYVW